MPYYQSNTLKHKLASSGRRGGSEVLERVCSKLGGDLDKAIVPVDSSVVPIDGPYTTRSSDLSTMVLRNIDCASLNAEYSVIDSHFSILDYLKTVNNPENNLYFYHSDHLGNSSFITDADGIATQHLQYLPYGELFVEQRDAANYYTPYKFSAKEKDEETGYSYFGARYYMPELSIWSTVDPMADKYPDMNVYNYCGLNPIKYIDPDGNEKVIWINKNNSATDAIIYNSANNAKDNEQAIHIYAHGSSAGITAIVNGKEIKIRTAKQFDNVMKKISEKWKNRKEGDNLTVVLHSCRTGRETKDGDESFVEKLSTEFKDVTFAAPDERDYFSAKNGELGPYKAKYADENADYTKFDANGNPNKEKSEKWGNWRVFKNGKEILRINGFIILLNPTKNKDNE